MSSFIWIFILSGISGCFQCSRHLWKLSGAEMSENIMEESDFLLKEQDQQQEGGEGVEQEEKLDLPLPDKNTWKINEIFICWNTKTLLFVR